MGRSEGVLAPGLYGHGGPPARSNPLENTLWTKAKKDDSVYEQCSIPHTRPEDRDVRQHAVTGFSWARERMIERWRRS